MVMLHQLVLGVLAGDGEATVRRFGVLAFARAKCCVDLRGTGPKAERGQRVFERAPRIVEDGRVVDKGVACNLPSGHFCEPPSLN